MLSIIFVGRSNHEKNSSGTAGMIFGAIIGAIFGVPIGEMIGAGAALGGASGAMSGAGAGASSQMNIIKRCMQGRGYSVLH